MAMDARDLSEDDRDGGAAAAAAPAAPGADDSDEDRSITDEERNVDATLEDDERSLGKLGGKKKAQGACCARGPTEEEARTILDALCHRKPFLDNSADAVGRLREQRTGLCIPCKTDMNIHT
jgi:hypothetical protein